MLYGIEGRIRRLYSTYLRNYVEESVLYTLASLRRRLKKAPNMKFCSQFLAFHCLNRSLARSVIFVPNQDRRTMRITSSTPYIVKEGLYICEWLPRCNAVDQDDAGTSVELRILEWQFQRIRTKLQRLNRIRLLAHCDHSATRILRILLGIITHPWRETFVYELAMELLRVWYIRSWIEHPYSKAKRLLANSFVSKQSKASDLKINDGCASGGRGRFTRYRIRNCLAKGFW